MTPAKEKRRAVPSARPEVLQHLSFLQGAGPAAVEALSGLGVEHRFPSGHVVLQEGSPGGSVYLIVEGQVEVVKGVGSEETVLACRGPGDLVGEMGLFDPSPRFATIRALGPVRLVEFSEQDLRSAFAQQPLLLHQTIRMLVTRLRQADLHMVSSLQQKNRELAQAYQDLQAAQAELAEKERLERELELARELQEGILPRDFPRLPGYTFAAHSRPARPVGGDLYDVMRLGKARVGLVMADVAGKGLPAALYMALAHSLIRAEAKRSLSPRRVLLSVHRLLMEISRANTFVTVFYGVLDATACTLRYVRAGHERPFLLRPACGTIEVLDARGMLLGLLEDVILEEATVRVHPGDLLVLYTDGFTEASSPAGEFYGVARLREAIALEGLSGAQGLCDRLFERVSHFRDGAAQDDDMALLVVQVEAGG